jgi:hypothetical protein
MSEQLSLNFDGASGPVSGMDLWREVRAKQIEALARHSGLPVGRMARVSLASGIMIEGRLALERDELWADPQRPPEFRLRIGHVDFRASEIESCVRLD